MSAITDTIGKGLKAGENVINSVFSAPGDLLDAAESTFKSLNPKQPKKPGDPTTPVSATPAPVMPTPDDEMIQAAKKRSLQEQMRRRGRASTILTDVDALGG